MNFFTTKLALGTVQLGLPYGVANRRGKPSRVQALATLERAYALGIRVFDTAAAYGDAEEILGAFVAKNTPGDVAIVSKLPPEVQGGSVEEAVLSSLRKLSVPRLEGCLFHRTEDFYDKGALTALAECKNKGLVENIGISVYEEKDALFAVNSGYIDYIQVPYNVFDRRLDKVNFFEKAREKNVRVFARSAFLQGLLLVDENNVPEHLAGIKPHIRRFEDIAVRHGLSRKEAAFLFSLAHPGIDYVVFGVDAAEQIDENVKIAEMANDKNVRGCMEVVKDSFKDVDEVLVRPDQWGQRKEKSIRIQNPDSTKPKQNTNCQKHKHGR